MDQWNKEELMLKLTLNFHMLEVISLNLTGSQIHLDYFWNNKEKSINRKEKSN